MTLTKECIIEELKASTQNASGMFEISEDTICALMSLLTAPPAPASVPDAVELDDDFDSAFEHGKAVGWNNYRAAMLHGADGNSPVTPDQPLAWKVIFTMHGQPGSNFKKIFEDEVAMESAVSLHRSGGYNVQVIPLIAHQNQ